MGVIGLSGCCIAAGRYAGGVVVVGGGDVGSGDQGVCWLAFASLDMTMLHIRRIAAASALVAVVFASEDGSMMSGGTDLPGGGTKGEGASNPSELPATGRDNSAQRPTMMEEGRGAGAGGPAAGKPMPEKCGTLAENAMCYNFAENGEDNFDCRRTCGPGLMCYGGPRRREPL